MTAPTLALGLSLLGATPSAYFQQEVAYRIEAKLNAKEHTLTGRSTIRYGNRSPAPIDDFYLHLYPNTYRDRFSTAAREQSFYHEETIRRIPSAERGYLDVERVEVDGQPVAFTVIDTLLRLKLPRPLAPGESIEVSVDWFEKVRKHVGGAGYRGRHYDMGEWYPKVAVYDESGWHAEQAHDVGGSYGELATFDVSLTVPRDYVVGATGELVEGDPGWEEAKARTASERPEEGEREDRGEPLAIGAAGSRKTVRFRAEKVHDFAWVADPAYLCEEGRRGATTVRVLYRPSQQAQWRDEVLARGLGGLEWLEGSLGAYPYPQLTIADALIDGGRDYPQLVMAGSRREDVLMQALAHLYFHGILANDEVRSAWLDEGFASSFARRYLTSRYGPEGENTEDLDPYERRLRRAPRRDQAERRALETARARRDEPVATVSYLFRDKHNYRPAVSDKAALFLDMLRSVLGPEDFDRAMRAYYDEWQFKHVNEARLRAVLERVAGKDLGAFFQAWLHSTRTGDYAVAKVRTKPRPEGSYDVAVTVERRDELVTPVDVLIHGRDGSERRLHWDGQELARTFELAMAAKPEYVVVDPDQVALDRNRLNNRRPFAIETVFAWPFQRYFPRDRYVLAWRPSAWYNDIDGLRGGLVVEGSAEGIRNRLKLAVSAGAKLGRFDYQARFVTPLSRFGRAEIEGEALQAEGRRRYLARLTTNLSSRWERRPQTRFEAGISSFEVTDLEYSPDRFEEGRVNQIWFRYGGEYAGPGWKSESYLQYQYSGRQINSDFDFNRFSAALAVRSTRSRTELKLRGFLGLSSDGDHLPREERFYLSGASPMAEFDHPGLRSSGSLLTYLNYHLPGEGNLRAYGGFPLSARRLFTVNLEAERRVLDLDSTPGKKKRGQLRIAGFADLGKAEGTGVVDLGDPLLGLGFGLRYLRKVYDRDVLIRLDLPFFINRPGLDEDGVREERAEPRWLLSFQPSW